MAKTLTKREENIHFGDATLEGFEPVTKEDAEKIISELGARKLWRCSVCNDMHIGVKPPKICPTCSKVDVYVEIDEKEFMSVMNV